MHPEVTIVVLVAAVLAAAAAEKPFVSEW